MRYFNVLWLFLVIIFMQLFSWGNVLATYKIPKDVLNEAGGASNSANYKILHNLGDFATGDSTSDTYKLSAGFLQPDKPVLLFSLSASTVNLGTLATGAVNTGNITLTTSTSTLYGYSIQAYDNTAIGAANGLLDGTKKIADATTPNVFIANPVAGTEHYGIIVTGTNADAGYAAGTKANSMDDATRADIASYTDFIASDSQTVTFRASISNTSPAGYSFGATATFICTANF